MKTKDLPPLQTGLNSNLTHVVEFAMKNHELYRDVEMKQGLCKKNTIIFFDTIALQHITYTS